MGITMRRAQGGAGDPSLVEHRQPPWAGHLHLTNTIEDLLCAYRGTVDADLAHMGWGTSWSHRRLQLRAECQGL